jgi:hypothetical protein
MAYTLLLVVNIAELFTDSGETPLSECNPSSSTCNFKVSPHSSYNSSASYSRVGFRTGAESGRMPDTNELTFLTFESKDCVKDDPKQAWHQWTCDSFVGDCAELPYSVRLHGPKIPL